jgi:hypothetical protein
MRIAFRTSMDAANSVDLSIPFSAAFFSSASFVAAVAEPPDPAAPLEKREES